MISETITSKRCTFKRCTRPTPIALIVTFTLIMSACGEVGVPASSGSETGAAVAATDPEEAIMEIELNDFNVLMSAVMPAGQVTLRLANRGFQEHNLLFVVVESDSTVWEIERRLSPGERRAVTLDLEAGTYWAVCDVSGHEDKGMSWEFVVEETTPSESGS
jgi:hypothetical protein